MGNAPTQLEYWNGPAGDRWAANQQMVDRNLASITDALFALAQIAPGERVVDVGCGCGTSTIRAAAAVGDPARVLGIDISAPQLAVARARAPAIAFREGDATTFPFAGDADLVVSRFGVMFFPDPTAAFAHLRRALAPGGRLAFVCWRAPDENAWWTAPLAATSGLLAIDPPEPRAPGPFAFAEPAYVQAILADAGFRDVVLRPHEDVMDLGPTLEAAADEAMQTGAIARASVGAPPELLGAIRARLPAVLAPHATARGITPRAAVWLVSARG